MEQLVIVLVIGAVGLVKWLMEKSAEQRAKRENEERFERLRDSEPVAPPMRAPRPVAPFPGNDTARRLREALGLPDESDLRRRRAPTVAPRPPAFQVEEIKVMPVRDLERRMMEPAPPLIPGPMPSIPVPAPQEPVAASRSGLEELLRSREGLRKAILVQEILGTPKGLVF